MEEINKISDTEFEKIIPQEPKREPYNMDFLITQEATLQAELARVQSLIAEGQSIGVKTTEELQIEQTPIE